MEEAFFHFRNSTFCMAFISAFFPFWGQSTWVQLAAELQVTVNKLIFFYNNRYQTIRASMGEPLFLDFSTAIERLSVVLPFLEHLDEYVSSCLTHVLSLVTEFHRIWEYYWRRTSYATDNASWSWSQCTSPLLKPTKPKSVYLEFFIICAAENAVLLA